MKKLRYDSIDETLNAYQEDYKKGLRQREEEKINKLTIKKLVWDRWKIIIGIVVSLITLILAIVKFIA